MTTHDTVFNDRMKPVFVDEPHVVKRRLHASHPESWSKVCIGETGLVVTIPQYLHAEKLSDIIMMLDELIRKSDLPMYKRNPARLKIYIESTAIRLIERAQEL